MPPLDRPWWHCWACAPLIPGGYRCPDHAAEQRAKDQEEVNALVALAKRTLAAEERAAAAEADRDYLLLGMVNLVDGMRP